MLLIRALKYVSTPDLLFVPNADHFDVCICEWLEEWQGEASLCFRGREKEEEKEEEYTLSKTAALAQALASVCNPIPLSNSVPH